MIRNLINRIFGRRSLPSTVPGDVHQGARPAPDAVASATPAARRTSRSGRGIVGKAGAKAGGPVMVPPSAHAIDATLLSANATRVTKTLQEAGFKAFVVGGAVRDLLLHVKPKDFDVATDATPEEIQRLFRRAHIIGRRFRLVHVMFGSDTIEVSTFRAGGPAPTAEPAARADARPAGVASPAGDVVVQVIPPSSGGRRDRRDRQAAGPLQMSDEHGRVLRDNVFGSQEEDAARRDFTVNALFYDPATQTVIDYHHGFDDVRARTLRMIGDPEQRYREDPVRMLRAVRFAAKLQFEIDEDTRAPIARLAPLLENVPAARLFDEMLKLLMSGHALACLKRLRAEGLHHGMLPLLDVVFEQPLGERFVTLALESTDDRIRLGKPTTPSFLFAALMWHEVLLHWNEGMARGDGSGPSAAIPALADAMDRVLDAQTETLAIQRRYTADMREIWGLQPRLERRVGRAPWRLLEHPRFRAGYDFLLLRAAAGEIDAALAEWWTRFIDADAEGREALQADPGLAASGPGALKRKRKRRKKPVTGDGASIDAATGGSRESTNDPNDANDDAIGPESGDDDEVVQGAAAVARDSDDPSGAEPAPKPRRRRVRKPATDPGVGGDATGPATLPNDDPSHE